MYQETTRRLMIFRNALKDRQTLKNISSDGSPTPHQNVINQSVQRSNSMNFFQSQQQQPSSFQFSNDKDKNAMIKRSQSSTNANMNRISNIYQSANSNKRHTSYEPITRPIQSSTPMLGNYSTNLNCSNQKKEENSFEKNDFLIANLIYNSDEDKGEEADEDKNTLSEDEFNIGEDQELSDNVDELNNNLEEDEFYVQNNDEDLDENDKKCLNYDDNESSNDLNSVSTNNREVFDRNNNQVKSSVYDISNNSNEGHSLTINVVDHSNQADLNNKSKSDLENYYSSKNYHRIMRNNLQNQVIFEEIEELTEEYNCSSPNKNKNEVIEDQIDDDTNLDPFPYDMSSFRRVNKKSMRLKHNVLKI
jgi:hypothetical protein